jgi:small-conductance mechanosensitive channel
MKLNISLPAYLINILVIVLFLSSNIVAQDLISTKNDTIKSSFNVAEISITLSEIELKSNNALQYLISESELRQLKKDNDSIINIIKKDLKKHPVNDVILSKKNNRRLGNTLIFWEQNITIIDAGISNISGVVESIDEALIEFTEEYNSINEVINYLDESKQSSSVQRKANKVHKKLNRIISELNGKKEIAIKILDNLTSTKGIIVPMIEEVEDKIIERRTNILGNQNISLFKFDYSDKPNWEMSNIANFTNGELVSLKTYINLNVGIIITHILLTLSLIFLFVYIHNNYVRNITDEVTSYKIYFLELLKMPRSIGLVMGLLLSILLYTTPPLIFSDLTRLILVIPIYLLLKELVEPKYYFYVYIYTIVFLIQLTYILLPEGKIFSRISLLTLSILEIWSASKYLLLLNKKAIFKKDIINKAIKYLTIAIIFVAAIGLLSNVLGFVMLSEILLFSVLGVLLVIILMALLLIVVNGLIILLIESEFADKINSIKNNRLHLINISSKLTNLFIFILSIYFLLKVIGFRDVIVNSISSWITKERLLGSLDFSIAGIFTFFFVIYLSVIFSRIIRSILEEDILLKMNLEKGLPNTISMMVRYTIVTIGLFIAISAAGIPFSEFAIIFSAFGVGIGFGLQNIFNNLVSGFILLFERPIKIGDTVEVGTLIGTVKSIGIRSSNVRTFDGAEIIVPNGNLISNEVVNWTLSDQTRRIEVVAGISYDADPHKAHEIFMNILMNHPDIVTNPKPSVFFRDLGESSLDFRLLFWTTSFDEWLRIKSEITFKVFDELKSAGIEIPFPQQDLHLRSIDDDVTFKKSTNITKQNED